MKNILRFSELLSLILIVAKIFGLIALTWLQCLAPFAVMAIIYVSVHWIFSVNLASLITKTIKELDKE